MMTLLAPMMSSRLRNRSPNLAAPEMRAATGFHRNDAGLQLAEEGQHLITTQLLSQHRPP